MPRRREGHSVQYIVHGSYRHNFIFFIENRYRMRAFLQDEIDLNFVIACTVLISTWSTF